MRSKILFVSAVLLLAYGPGTGAEEEGTTAVEQLIKDINDLLEMLHQGIPASDLETAATQIAIDAKTIIDDAGVEVTKEEAMTVLEQVAEALATGNGDIKNPLKLEAYTSEGSILLLDLLGKKLAEIVQSGTTDNLYETLLAVVFDAKSIVDGVEDVDDLIKLTTEMADEKTHEEKVTRTA